MYVYTAKGRRRKQKRKRNRVTCEREHRWNAHKHIYIYFYNIYDINHLIPSQDEREFFQSLDYLNINVKFVIIQIVSFQIKIFPPFVLPALPPLLLTSVRLASTCLRSESAWSDAQGCSGCSQSPCCPWAARSHRTTSTAHRITLESVELSKLHMNSSIDFLNPSGSPRRGP